MSFHRQHAASVVINIHEGHAVEHGAGLPVGEARVSTGQIVRMGRKMDPHQAHREWPGLWSDFLKTAFAGPLMVERICLQFQVNERTVRNWLKGQGGCNGRHVRVAMDYDPAVAMRTLFDMAAE